MLRLYRLGNGRAIAFQPSTLREIKGGGEGLIVYNLTFTCGVHTLTLMEAEAIRAAAMVFATCGLVFWLGMVVGRAGQTVHADHSDRGADRKVQ